MGPAKGNSLIAGWSLRARLVAGIVALLAVVFAIVGVVTVVALRGFLLDQLDGQLKVAGAVLTDRPPNGAPGGGGVDDDAAPNSDHGLSTGQPVGTVGLRIPSGGGPTLSGIIDSSGKVQALPAASDVVALRSIPVGQAARTIHLGGLSDYRVIAARAPDGDIVVTGLPLAGLQDTLRELTYVVIAVALAGLLIAALTGAAIVRWTLRPLRRVAATASRVATLKLDRGEVSLADRVDDADADPRTEAGQVGAALNQMLGHVGAALVARQKSETRVRQFVADASHELRTPLAAIRGYAELPRRSHEPLSPDVAHALGRVESEAIRMTTLVDDLLLLARLDSGRPLEAEPVDLSRLAVDVVGDAHVAGPKHRWQLELPDEAVTVSGDAARLHQVLANLLANARTHTPPGTTVTVKLSETNTGQARLSVIDDGPGIAPELLPSIFERFARGDSSRSRSAGSTGLGLAIVAAVVEAHRGSVSVSSVPGRTEFALLLPGLARPGSEPVGEAETVSNGVRPSQATSHPKKARPASA